MPHADYICPYCYTRVADVVFSMAVGAKASAPPCPACVCPQMEWIPAATFDLRTDGGTGKAGQKFTIARQVPTRDGLVQVPEVIDSAHARRQIERDSEQRYRDGEGEPIRFRADHQDASNLDQNSFGDAGRIGDRTYDSGQPPQKKSNIATTRHGEKKPRVPLGPGLRRATSSLKG